MLIPNTGLACQARIQHYAHWHWPRIHIPRCTYDSHGRISLRNSTFHRRISHFTDEFQVAKAHLPPRDGLHDMFTVPTHGYRMSRMQFCVPQSTHGFTFLVSRSALHAQESHSPDAFHIPHPTSPSRLRIGDCTSSRAIHCSCPRFSLTNLFQSSPKHV